MRINPTGTATGKCGLEIRNETFNTLVDWATSRKYNIMNTVFRKKAGKRCTWKNPNGLTKINIYWTLTNRPDIVTETNKKH